ncbi:MAG: hypothetical protein ACQKBW_07590, partial [Puniceicoccales bacterium]
MKVFFDMNNLAMRTFYINQQNDPSYDFWKYLMFEHVLNFVVDVSDQEDISEVVLAVDAGNYWRKDIYAPYKADRKKHRDDSIDWDEVFAVYKEFQRTIKKYLPWKVISVPKCEADDVIATLVRDTDERCVVHSGDSDYVQLLVDNVQVFSPSKGWLAFPLTLKLNGKEYLFADKDEYCKYAVLCGQGGKDNVYNVRTPTDWEPSETKKRKPPFGPAKAMKLIRENSVEEWLLKEGVRENYVRNQDLILFDRIPEWVRKSVREQAQECT